MIFVMTDVIVLTANRMQMPPSDAGIYWRWVKYRMVIQNRIRWKYDMGLYSFVSESRSYQGVFYVAI